MAPRKAKAKAPKAVSGKGKKRTAIDWDAIENEYRAGVISIRAIAASHGINDRSIRLRAEAEGWERCLLDKVQQAARAQLLRSEDPRNSPRTPEKEVVAAAAQVIVDVVREHQGMIRRGRNIVEQLLAEIFETNNQHDEIIKTIEAEPSISIAAIERKKRMLKAVSLPQRVGMITNLSAAMKNVTALERQAFSVDSTAPAQPDKGALTEAVTDELERRYGRLADAR